MMSIEEVDKIVKKIGILKVKKSDLDGFSKAYQLLGNTIAFSNYWDADIKNKQKKMLEAFNNPKPDFNPWTSKEGLKLAQLLFGEIRAPYIPAVWDQTFSLPYQTGYERRSFRMRASKEHFMVNLQKCMYLYTSKDQGFGKMTFVEQAQYSGYYNGYGDAFILSVALENKEKGLVEIIDDILQGEDEIGQVSRGIIKALLLSSQKEHWQMVERLLLAAQRQEGLRQTILEALDETSVGALQYMIKVILDNDLMRFSSVVRAVDTWFGFGWEAPKKSTIKRVLELAIRYFEDEQATAEALKSKDNLEVYVSLWVQGVNDVSVAINQAFDIAKQHPDKEKRLLAYFFIAETGRTQSAFQSHITKELGKDLEIDYWMLVNAPPFELSDALFNTLKTIAESIPKTGKKIEGQVFAWKSYLLQAPFFYTLLIKRASESQLETLAKDISAIPSEVREAFMRKLFPKHFGYSWSYHHNKKELPTLNLKKEDWKRAVAHQAITDRNAAVRYTGIQLFNSISLETTEFEILEKVLLRKGKDLREAAIKLLIKQPEKQLKQSTESLIHSTKEPQRLAALEMLTILEERELYTAFVQSQITRYKERPKFSKNEQVFIAKFSKTTSANSFKNGFGVIDLDKLSPLITPQIKFKEKKGLLKKIFGGQSAFKLGHLINIKKTVVAVNALIALFQKHKDYEYQHPGYGGETLTTLLANGFSPTKKHDKNTSAKAYLEMLPLAQVWIDWYEAAGLNDFEMYTASQYASNVTYPYGHYEELHPFAKSYLPDFSGFKLSKTGYYQANRNIIHALNSLLNAYGDQSMLLHFKLDVLEDMVASFPESLKKKNLEKGRYSYQEVYWYDRVNKLGYTILESEVMDAKADTALLKRLWDLEVYLFAQKLGHPSAVKTLKSVVKPFPKRGNAITPAIYLTLANYSNKTISKDDLLLQALYDSQLIQLLDGGLHWYRGRYELEIPPQEILKPLKVNLLQVELERGDINTEASSSISDFSKVEGMHYVFEVLERLGKENFERGYSYADSKKSTFSRILKLAVPSETDTLEDFIAKVNASKVTKKRLIEVACYATQWAGWIGVHLKLEQLEAAVWWFHAHASEYMNAEKETLIARYSNIESSEFTRGAIDIDWFNRVYKSVGKANWKLLHDASKYISHGNAHRQVKLYSSVMLGEVKITETLKKITEKRDKDYVRALGLIPLSKTVPEKDVLKRYNLLQEFLKQSKQFGAQRQQSEKNAVEIALDNLSRNAGYLDRVRFSWAMEGKATQQIMENARLELDKVVIELQIDAMGKAQLIVEKDGKKQKSIPTKYKKDKGLLKLKENKSYLVKQHARTRLSLENAMLREDRFTLAEIEKIMRHPVVKALLSKLVLFNKDQQVSGFYKDGNLVDTEGKQHQLDATAQVIIAHPSHLYTAVQWDLYQKYLFNNAIVQPFKQVFRELYLITANERENSWRSHRYQGHQVQTQKTVALLRKRGWTVSHDEGLQKVYHEHNFMVTIQAMADWFSPADIESPTLEYVSFHSLKTYKPIALADIPKVIFSEVMRDLDLVVSVAHVGGVDPEASHSTMEMRAVLATESARLFKLDNVTVKERHLLIKGRLGDYSIHLGSANVSKNGLALNIIPVHSQHRGRLFLPFVDDDPKSAEVISKMKLLAQDDKIKDPTVLAQINKRT